MKHFYSILIANFNGENYLADCLDSVFSSVGVKFEVVFIDDASTDGSLAIVSKYKKQKNLRVVVNKTNKGLVKNRNVAIKLSRGDILVFLDNDTEVDKNWLRNLGNIFDDDKSVGAAQCKIFDFNHRDIIQQVGMKLIPYTGFGMTLGRGENDSKKFSKRIEIISLGAAIAVRKEVAVKIGGFDSRLFHYTDDLDFSWRIWISGYKIVLAPNSKVYHYIKIHKPNSDLYFHLTKNSIRMVLKNYELVNVLRFVPLSIFINLMGAFLVLTRGSLAAFIGVVKGFKWSIDNLTDTLNERKRIQKNRVFSDNEIMDKVMVNQSFFKIVSNYFKGTKITEYLMKT